MLRTACALSLVAATAAGCVIPVVLDFDTCTDEGGVEHLSGDSYQVGCRACACENGQEQCSACACQTDDGRLLSPGEVSVASDGCTTCTCLEDGTVSCTTTGCVVCDAVPPACPAAPPGCVNEPICTEHGWDCRRECDGCDAVAAQMFDGCPPTPDGCWWSGPICDDGVWSCGELVCEGCLGEPPPCFDPGMNGCVAYAWCDGLNWICDTACDPPYCMDPAPDCTDPMLPPECISSPVCTPMGWVCQPDCYNCVGEPKMCGSMEPDCVGTPFCNGLTWECTLVCG